MKNRIRELRRAFGITQEKLARDMNITQASVSLYEQGTNIPTDMVIAMSEYFHVSTDYLLGVNSAENISVSREENMVLTAYRVLNPGYRRIVNIVADKIINDRHL